MAENLGKAFKRSPQWNMIVAVGIAATTLEELAFG